MVAMKSRDDAFMAEPKPEGLAANRKRGKWQQDVFVSTKSWHNIFFTNPCAYAMFAHSWQVLLLSFYTTRICQITQILWCLAPFSTYHLMPREKSISIASFFADGRNWTQATCAASEYTAHYSIASQHNILGPVGAQFQHCPPASKQNQVRTFESAAPRVPKCSPNQALSWPNVDQFLIFKWKLVSVGY